MDKLNLNEFKIVGTLIGADVKKGTRQSNGASYVSVKATIESTIEGKVNTYEVELFANEQTQKNTVNKLYEAYCNLPSLLRKKVSVTGDLAENRYFSTKNNVMASSTRLRGKFIKGEIDTMADQGTFTVGGFVVSELAERKNKNQEIYRYDFVIGQPNYNNTMMSTFTLNVNPENIEAVRGVSSYHSGDTVKVEGNLEFIVQQVVVEDTNVGFGKPMSRVYTNKNKAFYVTGGSNPFKDESAYTMEEIRNLVEAYKANDVQIQASAESKTSSSAVVEEAPISRRQTSLI